MRSKLNNSGVKFTGVAPHCFNIDKVNVYACCVVIVLDFTDNNGLLLAIVITRVVHSYVGLYLNYIVVITLAIIFIIILKPYKQLRSLNENDLPQSVLTFYILD